MSIDRDYRTQVIEQFTRQAGLWSALSDDEAIRLLIRVAEIGPADDVLDVACGPGLVACAVAAQARRVVGIDLTPAMIEEARARQARQGLSNVHWRVGDVSTLPFAAHEFDAVLTRYSLHHMPAPRQLLIEMARVTKPSGRVVVADLILPAEKGRVYDAAERLRDPSHRRVLADDELVELFAVAGLRVMRREAYVFELSLAALLAGSFPANPSDIDRLRALYEQDVGVDRLGIGMHRANSELRIAYPIVVVAARKLDGQRS
jgi:ubiquinone/menaquinone biosynthesis C-methylase UbiE